MWHDGHRDQMEVPMKTKTVEWGVASLTAPGESESGDRYMVESFDGGALIAVMDALGHGHAAAQAADVAARTLASQGHEALDVLAKRCHARLRTTRGVTLSMASFDSHRRAMTWLGIGNVTGVLMFADPRAAPRIKSLLVRGGVVGYRLPKLLPSVVRVTAGDTLILATDGVRDDFAQILPAAIDPQPLANRILSSYARHDDDALVLVVRCNGDD